MLIKKKIISITFLVFPYLLLEDIENRNWAIWLQFIFVNKAIKALQIKFSLHKAPTGNRFGNKNNE